MRREANWYGLDRLPMYLKMSKELLHASEKQLQNMQTCEQQPYLLDDALVDRTIKAHTKQNEMLWAPIEQCRRWREQSPSKVQLSDTDQTESNFEKVATVNKQILNMAHESKKRND